MLQPLLVNLVLTNVKHVGDHLNISVSHVCQVSFTHMKVIHVVNGWGVEMDFEMILKSVMMET